MKSQQDRGSMCLELTEKCYRFDLMWYVADMNLWTAIRKLLPTLAIVGFILAPLSQPAMAMPVDMQTTMGEHTAMADHSGMAAQDMPCCPHDQQMPDCGKDCSLMAICAASLISTLPDYAFNLPLVQKDTVVLRTDGALDSLSQRPPPRPPKT